MRLWLCLALTAPGPLVAVGAPPAVAPLAGERADSMRVELVVPRSVEAGAPVPMAIRIANTTDRPLELHLQGRKVSFDLIVRRGDAVVWRRLEGATVPAILQLRMLAPGEVLELADTWAQQDNAGAPVQPGEYSVTGTVPTDGTPIRAGPLPLTIDG